MMNPHHGQKKMNCESYDDGIAKVIPKTSQASAWCYRYIGRWMCKTEGSPTGLGENFGRLNG